MGRPLAAPEAQAKGLVLTDDGVADPQQEKEEETAYQAGIRSAQGMDADWPRRHARFTTARPSKFHWRARQNEILVVFALAMNEDLLFVGFQQQLSILRSQAASPPGTKSFCRTVTRLPPSVSLSTGRKTAPSVAVAALDYGNGEWNNTETHYYNCCTGAD